VEGVGLTQHKEVWLGRRGCGDLFAPGCLFFLKLHVSKG